LNFRFRRGRQTARLRLVPEPITDPRSQASGPPAALVDIRPGGAHGLQFGRQPTRHIARNTGIAAIDHDRDTLNGQSAFSNIRRQHDFSTTIGARLDRSILFPRAKCTKEGGDAHICGKGEPLRRPPDFAGSGQEGQHGAIGFAHSPLNRPGHLVFEPVARSAQIPGFDRILPAFADNHGRIEFARHGVCVERG